MTPPTDPAAWLLTDEWLQAHGFRQFSPRNDPNTRETGFRLRPIAHEVAGGRQPFVSHDDLCIAVAPGTRDCTGSVLEWYCWVYQLEPYRHIHVRPVQTVADIVGLYEGLTGRRWSPAS